MVSYLQVNKNDIADDKYRACHITDHKKPPYYTHLNWITTTGHIYPFHMKQGSGFLMPCTKGPDTGGL